jgi:transposase
MPTLPDQLPDDVNALKALLAEQVARNAQLEAEKQASDQENVRLGAKVLSLQEQLNLALARRYAASSEKFSPDQIRLFDEAEADALADPSKEAGEDDVVEVPAHTRKKRGRKPLPDTLHRVDVIHEIPEEQRHCPHDGQLLAEINQVVSEQLDIIPAQIRVIRHIRKQYACACGQCIQTATLPGQPIPKSMASPGLLAHIAVSKYQDALPLHRQEQGGYPPGHPGELDDPLRAAGAAADQPAAGLHAGL